ncbi:SAM-dependent methyltransferase [Actinomycetospora termitidis]|uniref:SAM-dependent methyltransferase n=1 Tax=Actinomycetospora termitidis TaxID=3053470 RepID=A0ABT7MHM4_9PSEU|nr:SAM-dependent methyltransferase [Actinomycetospora sp. Odt1-22]MDL5158833.1 SAM-dependent methyltransferase [Actinomycetospora sp. Odt1-22]
MDRTGGRGQASDGCPELATRPNLARATNYLVGGGANFAPDRAAVNEMLAMDPGLGRRIQAGRAFVARAVRDALDGGCDQFLELGAGIPSPAGLHSLVGPDARVVYVDVDPVAVAHTRDLLAAEEAGRVAVVEADLRDAAGVLTQLATGPLDLGRPVTLVCNSVLQWVADSDGTELARTFEAYRSALAPGSRLVISVAHPDELAAEEAAEVRPIIEAAVAPLRLRGRAELDRILGAWEPLPPGIVDAVDWPVASGAETSGFYAVVCAARR